ncbi:MAG: HAMP domain-containing histidine kinase [Bacteroidales bacterium]|nr:HAMP domain-containing histidine kinase [Bacteroidales bacterium]
MLLFLIIAVIVVVIAVLLWLRHQRVLRQRAWLIREAIRNRDFSFRLPTKGLPSGERAMQETLNELGNTIRQQVNQNEVESWERLTRVLTHEIMNATAPITSISQSLLKHPDINGSDMEDGIKAIYDTSRHLSEFVSNYRKMSELEHPVLGQVDLNAMLDEIRHTYPQVTWEMNVHSKMQVWADAGMLRQVLMNLTKNAMEANAQKIVIEATLDDAEGLTHDRTRLLSLYIGNDGTPIPAENRMSLFVPFFTTKRSGSGIGLSLSRRMMLQQGGMLELADRPLLGCHVTFLLSIPYSKQA